MKILLVNDTGQRENLGCQLTSRTLAASLRNAFATDGSAPAIVSAPWGFAPRLPPMGRAARRALSTGRGVLTEPVLRDLARGEYGGAALAAADEANVVVFQPEGTISDDHGPLRILRNLSLPLWVALRGRRPLAVTNGTFPLFDDPRRGLIRLLLDRAAHASLRDRLSAEFWGTGFAPDTAVLWPGLREERPAAPDHLLLTTGAEVEPARDLAIGRAALALCRDGGLRPLVLTKGWRRLDPLRGEVAALGGTFVERADLDEANRWLSRCRLHVGGRYHMALLCATKGVPSALVRTNTHKNLWLARDFAGIRLAATETELRPLGHALLAEPLPAPGLLEDMERHRALQREDMARLRAAVAQPTRPAPMPDLAPDLAAALAREARADLWRGRLRRLLGRR